MLLTRRSFERREPERDAKCVYIFCEGAKREYQYFEYFVGLSEKIKVVIYPIDSYSDDHSPLGLFKIACNCLNPTKENPNPIYELSDDVDEVWIVFDKDPDKKMSRETQIFKVKEECTKENQHFARSVWNIAESNPCFEVWLYYHQQKEKPDFEEMDISAKWKPFVNSLFNGGFDSQRHPSLIKDAIVNAEKNHLEIDERPTVATTQVYRLGQSIYSLVKSKLRTEYE